MDNRFGAKDLVVSVLLLGILVSIWIAIYQFDRQWDVVYRVSERQQEQARDMQQILHSLRQGVTVGGGGGVASGEELGKPDYFERIRRAQESEDYSPGDWVVDAFGVNIEKVTPLVSTDIYQSVVESYVVETLATRNPDTLEWVGLLARDWEIEDNTEAWREFVEERSDEVGELTEEDIRQEPEFQLLEEEEQQEAYIQHRLEEGVREVDVIREAEGAPEAMSITFEIREEARFSDGEPVTAEDVAFTFDLIMNSRIDAPRSRAYYQRFSEVEALGEREVVFRADQPYFRLFDFAAGIPVLPKHFYEQFSERQINEEPGLLMGSGPYRMETPTGWSPGATIRLLRNERYWGEYPTFDELRFRTISEDLARMQEFRNRTIDMFNPSPEQHEELLQSPEVIERTQHYEYETVTSGYRFIAWNQRRDGEATWFADPRVRQAMTMLTDRQSIIDQIYYGYAQLATGPFHPLGDQYDETIEPWPHDTEAARDLLSEAGFEQDGSGVLRDAEGNAFRFQLTYPADSETAQDMAYFLRDAYARVGIEVRPDPLDWSIFRERLQSRNFDAITLGWGGGGPENDPFQIFHSSQMAEGGDNFVSYQNEELDALIEEARETVVEEERMPLWREVHAILHEDQPYTFLMHGESLRWLDERFQNVEEVTLGLNDRVEWYVPSLEQRWTD